VERWAVKTLTDPAARLVSLTPQPTTIAALRRLPRPAAPVVRVPGVETTTYRVRARLLGFKVESDSDVHLVIADPQSGGTMIAEFPASYCTVGAPQHDRTLMAQARQALVRACGQPNPGFFTTLSGTAMINGVGFFDFDHGQRGVAPNAIELHPVLAFANAHCSQAP
jgi:hypothetical protein